MSIVTVWTVKNQTQSVTYSGIQSLNFSTGRQAFIDDYQGNTASITLLNNNESTFVGNLGDQIRIYPEVGGSKAGAMTFWIISIIYNDQPGSMANSSITIIGEDNLARLGRRQVSNIVTSAFYSIDQAGDMVNTYGSPVNFAYTQSPESRASSQTWSGSIADFIRQCLRTEQGQFNVSPVQWNSTTAEGGRIYLNGRRAGTSNVLVYGPKSDPANVTYQGFQRNKFFSIFSNNVQVNPVGLASQTASNTTSVTAYGNYSTSQTSNDYSTSQALGLAQYLANVLSDLTLLNTVITFTDVAQDNSGFLYTQFAISLSVLGGYKSTLKYRQPGDTVDRELSVVATGYTVNVTPEQTTWTVYLAPFSVYNFFILNSSTQGVLDSSRLGWK